MNTYYKIVNWVFNVSAWAQAIQKIVEILGSNEAAAEYLDVHPLTIRKWAEGKHNENAPYPMMTNFLLVINLIDERRPERYFELEDIDG